jgi:hypothetical protein
MVSLDSATITLEHVNELKYFLLNQGQFNAENHIEK